MYGLAYVIIPVEFSSLQTVLDEALAPFRRGGPDRFPQDKLEFDDVTDHLRQIHEARFTFEARNGLVIRGEDPVLIFNLDSGGLSALLDAQAVTTWSGRLVEIEPDFDAFAARFTKWKRRDPAAGAYGQWINPLGRWDWWELGGRFDGVISGNPQRAGNASMISSGPDNGRDLMGGIVRSLGGAPSDVEAEIDANIELVSALLGAARLDERRAFPTALVLPAGACPDGLRWFNDLGWRPIPCETKTLLAAPADASFKEVALAAYERFQALAAAAVAYHF